jgi:hypothetical protein
MQKLPHKMYAYKQLGYVYHLQRKPPKALNAYKKMLYLAWYHDQFGEEMASYQGIAAAYFALG